MVLVQMLLVQMLLLRSMMYNNNIACSDGSKSIDQPTIFKYNVYSNTIFIAIF